MSEPCWAHMMMCLRREFAVTTGTHLEVLRLASLLCAATRFDVACNCCLLCGALAASSTCGARRSGVVFLLVGQRSGFPIVPISYLVVRRQ